MIKLILGILIFILFFVSDINSVYAQEKTVTGTVKDKEGEGLPGVNVVVKGTTTGTVTDFDGKYSLRISSDKTLVFSYIGFEKQEVLVGTQSKIDIFLKADTDELEEVVVTGYGDISKRLYTGNAESLSLDDVKLDGVGDVSQMLQGRSAGVVVQSVSGTFGAGPKINIRGASSINGNGSPLWVIDGVVQEDLVNISAADLVSGNTSTLLGSSVAGLNPNDIESFEILKDASATAIYGSRSLNGVIVITTKKGKGNQPLRFNYSGEFFTRNIPSYTTIDVMNSKENFEVLRELEKKGLLDVTVISQNRNSGVYGIMANQIEKFDIGTGKFALDNTPAARAMFLRQYEQANTDWFQVLFKKSMTQSHTFSFSGGSERNNYYASLGYYKDPGWTVADNVGRLTLNLKNTMNVGKKAKLGFNLLGSYRQQRAPGSFDRKTDDFFGSVSREFDINPYSYVLNTSRTLRPYGNNGKLEYHTLNYAPFNILEELENNYIDLKVQDIKLQINFSTPIYKDKIKYNFVSSFRYANTDSEHYVTEKTNVANAYRAAGTTIIRKNNPYLYEDLSNPTALPVSVLEEGGMFFKTQNFLRNYYIRNIINYSEKFNMKHDLDIMVGQEARFVDRNYVNFSGYGLDYERGMTVNTNPKIIQKFVNQSGQYFNVGSPENVNATPKTVRERTMSLFSRITYGYLGKYVMSFTANVNSSNFQLKSNGNPRWTPTWTVSGKWNILGESFMEKTSKITELSTRISYGLTATAGNASNTFTIFRPSITDRLIVGDREVGINIADLQNADLTWEKQYELNWGLDMGFLDGRISMTFDIYKRNGFDLFDFVNTSGIGGERSKYINNADMVTKGLEFSVRTVNIKTENFRWTTTFNYARFNQEITSLKSRTTLLGLVDDTGGNYIGFPRNALFSIRFTGLDSRGLPQYDIPSKDKFKGVNFQDRGSNIEPTGDKPGGLLSYLKYEGPTEANTTASLMNSFSYKQWTFSIFISAAGGNKIRLPNLFRQGANFTDLMAYSSLYNNRWIVPGDEKVTNVPVIPDERTVNNIGSTDMRQGYNAYNFSTERVADGSFVRVKNISLAYNFSKEMCKKLKVRNLRLSGQMQNPILLYSDKKLRGIDPEFFSTGGVALPITKQYTISLNFGI